MSLRGYLQGCARKKRFRTEEAAKNFGDKWGQRAYHCPSCNQWHLTSRVER